MRVCWLLVPCAALSGPRIARRDACCALASATSIVFAPRAARASAGVDAALRLFNAGDYAASLEEWTVLTAASPDERLYWSNRGTVELILGSRAATLGVAPTGRARELLSAAVSSFERAEELGDGDPVSLNNKGNALGVLLRWGEAATAYDAALDSALRGQSDRSFAAIPASNRAQAALELDDLEDAERRVSNLLRKDPNFLDGRALLAAIRSRRGDREGAEQAFARLCVPAIASPDGFNTPRKGLGGTDWCELYSTRETVLGRWTPKSIAAFDTFLAQRPRSARLAANTKPFGEADY